MQVQTTFVNKEEIKKAHFTVAVLLNWLKEQVDRGKYRETTTINKEPEMTVLMLLLMTMMMMMTVLVSFDVLLTALHLSIFSSVINQLDAQNFCFTISLFRSLYMFRAPCAHHQEVRIALHSKCDDTRGCVMQF